MEQTESTQEQNMRLNIKQTSKGSYYCEFTARGNTIDEVKARIEELRGLDQEQLKILNVNIGG